MAEKLCPLLELCGIVDTVKDKVTKGRIICEKCPLQQCCYDYSGHVTKGDRTRLETYYYTRVAEEGKLWWK